MKKILLLIAMIVVLCVSSVGCISGIIPEKPGSDITTEIEDETNNPNKDKVVQPITNGGSYERD